jgi:hypothetical protein
MVEHMVDVQMVENMVEGPMVEQHVVEGQLVEEHNGGGTNQIMIRSDK